METAKFPVVVTFTRPLVSFGQASSRSVFPAARDATTSTVRPAVSAVMFEAARNRGRPAATAKVLAAGRVFEALMETLVVEPRLCSIRPGRFGAPHPRGTA